jgi:23S rRNA pseudouridine2605 synthase
MPDSAATADHREGQRIAKVMARAGLCSRREAEAWVLAGRVSVNGETLASPAYNVSERDDVRVDGAPLRERERTRLFLFHKPRGLVTTARDPEGRATIFDALPSDLPRVVAVGRLDINTEGLILLTNDGGLARILELPATGWLRRYRVRAHGAVEQSALDALREGVSIEGIHYAGIEARVERQQGSNVWLSMGLREGKNREIKRVLEHLGLSVNRLIRISFGPFELGDLGEREVEETSTRVLRDQLGPKLAREAGVDFDAPVVERAPPPPPEPPAPREYAREARRGPREDRKDHAPRGARDERREFKPRAPRPETARSDERRPPREDRKEFRSRDQLRGPRPERPEIAPRGRAEVSAPAPSHPQRKRKHVGKLRAEIAAGTEGPRKRIERSATADRKGRVVAVERILPTREEQRRRDDAAQKAQTRRDEAAQKADTRRGRQRSGESERRRDFAPRGVSDEARSSEFASRRPGAKRFDKAALSRGAERPPRDGKPQSERAEQRGPPSRGGKPGGKPGSKPRGKPGGRPDFKAGGKPGGSRPPRRP